MKINVDPSDLEIGRQGEVKIEDPLLSRQIAAAFPAGSQLFIKTNLGCTNEPDCSDTSNVGGCTNKGVC